MIAGGYSKFRDLTEDESKLFEGLVSQMVGGHYEPFAVATQIVAGTNYKFLCNATLVTNPPKDYTAKVVVFAPLDGEPSITSIDELDA